MIIKIKERETINLIEALTNANLLHEDILWDEQEGHALVEIVKPTPKILKAFEKFEILPENPTVEKHMNELRKGN